MGNAGDDQEDVFMVVVNHENQHALWPDYSPFPNGWTVKFGPDKKPACLECVKQNWTDMRPKSVIEATETRSASNQPH